MFNFIWLVLILLECSSTLLFGDEDRFFKNIRQLTFSGINAEAYFSFDNQQITFQATNYGYRCDQIFRFDNISDDMSQRKPKLISTGLGRTTCSYFLPDDHSILYASTHLANPDCPMSSCSPEITSTDPDLKKLCQSVPYVWDVYPSFDIFQATEDGFLYKRLTDTYGYDAEATVSPDGRWIVYTSMASGDLELWIMEIDGREKRQITNQLGYDGGAFFSPDSRKLIFRASRPKTTEEIDLYRKLLSYNLVSPLKMELYEVEIFGSKEPRQVTSLGGSNWAPYYDPSGRKIVFSSNHKNPQMFNFQLFSIDADGKNLHQITNGSTFNSFPMFTSDGKFLIFGSNRNSTVPHEMNLFLAEWNNDNIDDFTLFYYKYYQCFRICNFMLWCFALILLFSSLILISQRFR